MKKLLLLLSLLTVFARSFAIEYNQDGDFPPKIDTTFTEETDSVEVEEPEDPGYYFKHVHVDMTVSPKGQYIVQETFDTYFTLESHGIFRAIPTWVWVKRDVSDNQDGSQTKMMHYKVRIDDTKVNKRWEDISEFGDSLYVMRIGDANIWLEGDETFTISYTLHPFDDRVSQSDLFFYSIYGAGWDCRTERFTFDIHFEQPLTNAELSKLKMFTGKLGNGEDVSELYITKRTNTDISGEVIGIRPKNAVTLFVPLHEGYFAKSSRPAIDIIVTYIFIAIAVILALYALKKEFIKKKGYTKTISFYPPEGCSSADVGTIIDTTVDDRDIISLIPWFAEQGYLTIDNTGKNPILHKVKDLPDDAQTYLKKLFNGFFPDSKTEFDTGKPHKKFGAAWLACEKELNKKFENKLDDYDEYGVLAIVGAILAISFANCFANNSCDDYVVGGITTLALGAVFFFCFVKAYIDISGCITRCFVNFIAFCFIMGYAAVFMDYLLADDGSYVSTDIMFAANLPVFLACLFSKKLTFMTEYRRKRIGQILGLQEFIRTAEKQQLEQLQAEDEKYYYRVLPYAVAFGMASTWAKRFNGIIIKPVEFYVGNNIDIAHMMTKSNMQSSLYSSAKTERDRIESIRSASSGGSSYSSSSSYSSGGGGYSGGGFGGGGGGRW